jgi:ABC-2 type transport system permease protein
MQESDDRAKWHSSFFALRTPHSALRTFLSAAWLGWQVETNWTSPWLFLIYVLLKPMAGSMLLVCMYWAACAARGGATEPGYLPYLFISSTCFMVIGGVTYGMSTSVVTDRDSFGMLKFIRISPAHFKTYLLGRGVAKAAQAVIGASTTIVAGLVIFPELREALTGGHTAWAWLTIYLLLGAIMASFIGLILSGAVLNMARYGIFLSEGVAAMLFLFSGAVFPIGVLPVWLRAVSLSLPPTYWLEGMRRSLLSTVEPRSPMHGMDHAELALTLLASTLLLAIVGLAFFRWSERRASRLGRFDEVVGI